MTAKNAPDGASGSVLAKAFMRSYFNKRFRTKEKVLKIDLPELIWAFRNPHSHAFYPYSKKNFDGTEVNGGVMWLYKDMASRTGISIEEVEKTFAKYSRRLYEVNGNWFYLCPQVLLVYFKRGIDAFVRKILKDRKVRGVFLENYRRLAPTYRFDLYEEGN